MLARYCERGNNKNELSFYLKGLLDLGGHQAEVGRFGKDVAWEQSHRLKVPRGNKSAVTRMHVEKAVRMFVMEGFQKRVSPIVRQTQVGQNDIWRLSPRDSESFLSASGGQHQKIVGLKIFLKGISQVGLILDQNQQSRVGIHSISLGEPGQRFNVKPPESQRKTILRSKPPLGKV